MPTWTPEITSVNQSVQLGVEAAGAHGTAVAASKSLRCFSWIPGITADIAAYGATGRKYDQTAIENSEGSETTSDGYIDYNGIIYALASAMGNVSPTAHGSSSTAKDWTFVPPVSGSIEPATYTFQQGDSTRARQLAYLLCTDFSYKGDRKAGLTTSGKWIGQPISEGITLTGSPSAIALAPLAGKHINVYLDTSAASLGTTQITKEAMGIDYSFGGVYGGYYPFNRANLGFTSHVDMKPKTAFKLLVQANSVGMALLTTMQNGTTGFLRIDGQGLIIDNLQTLTFGGGVTGGTFTLSYKGQTTAPITYSATLAATVVNTAFQLLSTVNTNCTVSGSNGGPYTFTFSGALASDMSPVTATNVSLVGGTPTMTLVAQAYNKFTHDMAVKVSKPNPFQDKDGVWATEWEFTIVEDGTWGKAQQIVVTNLLTAL